MTAVLQRLVAALENNELRDVRKIITEEMGKRALKTVWLMEVPPYTVDQSALLQVLQLDRKLSEQQAYRVVEDVRMGNSASMVNLNLDVFDRLSRIPGVVLRME